MKNRLLVNAVMREHHTHNFLKLSVCWKNVSCCVCVCAYSRGVGEWGEDWLIKKSVLITIHGCLHLYECLFPSGLYHTV